VVEISVAVVCKQTSRCRSVDRHHDSARRVVYLPTAQVDRSRGVQNSDQQMTYRERKCADTIGTVLVPRASHFQ